LSPFCQYARKLLLINRYAGIAVEILDAVCILFFTLFSGAFITFVMSVRLSAKISTAATGLIFAKFDTRDFYENLSIESKCG
jgi:hypothetical protein